MVKLDNVTEGVLDVINDNKFSQTGALICVKTAHQSATETASIIKIKKKTDKPGIDIYIDGKNGRRCCLIPCSTQQIRYDRPCIQ